MKFILTPVIVISFCLSITFLSRAFAQDKEDIINKIDETVESIHLDTALKSVTLQNMEFIKDTSETAGELTGFFKGNKIYKIYRSVGLSAGVEITEFYYRKNQLIFIREKFNSYVYDESSKTFDYTKLNPTYSGYYYFNNDKLIKYKTNGHDSFEDKSLNIENYLINKSNESVYYVRKLLK